MPMRVIGMLLGIPETDQEAIRDRSNATMRTEAGKPMTIASEGLDTGEVFAQYIDWRAEHPSDDIMTELLHIALEDEAGTIRRLTRDELLIYVNVVAGAGNETTTRLIGWTGKVLAEHPDQRWQLVEDNSLIPRAIEELLRYEPAAPHVARYVTRDVEYYGQTVPEGSVMMMLICAANRDHRHFPPDGDVFDIHREVRQHLTFSVGTHYCLGSALARLEGRIALEETLKRFPEWDVDLSNAKLSPTSTVRGWEAMPAVIRSAAMYWRLWEVTMAGRVEGKVAFITGAARGQGRAHAVRLAQEGADIIAVDICKPIESVLIPLSTPEDLAETADLVKGHNRRIFTAEVDVRDYDALKSAVDTGVEELGRLDIIVANAGIGNGGATLDKTSERDWTDMIDVNLAGVWKTL